ncbi:MAG: type II toxin-antitoxin system RelB/DinJ family antitoxin [Spirochaetaceae bacterium]|nr:type II toxin-antitoxin system RelB/DinJ family antitoxin [Spirochaetaceae bacterium]
MKNANVSIRLDSRLKEQTEAVLEQFGLNMSAVVTMLFHQIVREQAIPLSLTLNSRGGTMDMLNDAKNARLAGFKGRSAESVIADMKRIVADMKYDAADV